ncbi:MAG: MCE family protein, partial [Deltaproteobacteria bacterium]|nr:MCE family protein [Deltaproteobacteria bacterium]
MASTKTKFAVGLFVAGGITLVLLAIIWLGVTRYFEKGQFYVTYFNESVQGLDKDSPVKYRGVSIGRVEKIGVAPDSKLIQVILKIESGQKLGSNMVAQMKPVGITGSMFIELDQKGKDEPDRSPHLSFPSKYPIVASKPSEISELFTGIDNLLNQLNAIDLEGISDKLKLTLVNLNQSIVDVDVKSISANLVSSLESIDQILEEQRWNSIVDSADSNLQELEKTLMKLESILSHLQRHLVVTGQNLEKASTNFNRLLEVLADQPSQLLFGEPPPPRKVEPD